MTQVWMLRNSDTDIHLFNRYDHLEPSVRISYSACKNVKIEKERCLDVNKIMFVVSGTREGKDFTDKLVFTRLPVWTEPSHL